MKKTCHIVGWVILVLVAGIMLLAGSGKVFGFAPEEVVKGLDESRLKDQMRLIGIAEMVSAILLLIPRTWSIGILLASSFWGGEIVSHMTKDDSYHVPAILLLMTWVGTFLRNPESLTSFHTKDKSSPPS